MAGVNHVPVSSDIRPCSGLERRRICLPFLPKEIIFKILLCLPMDILYNVMRYVCREWYNIIRDPIFIDAHLQESPAGILIQLSSNLYSTFYVEMREHGVQIIDLNFFPEGMGDGKGFSWFQPSSQALQFEELHYLSWEFLKFPGQILASCNGLVLVSDRRFRKCLHVANLFLRQWINLPPLIGKTWMWSNAGLGYVDSSKVYKVAYTYYAGEQCYHCAILTLGVDKAWRCISSIDDMSGILPGMLRPSLFMGVTYSTGQYIHWICSPAVLSLEVETESFHMSVAPHECRAKRHYFLATESCLCSVGVWEGYIFELSALVDVEMGHWKKLLKIDLAAQIPVLRQRFGLPRFDLSPFGLLKNGELFILRVSYLRPYFMIYNVKTEVIHFFETDYSSLIHPCAVHVQSLVSLKRRGR